MSTSFDVYPTTKYIPRNHELLLLSKELFQSYLNQRGILYNVDLLFHFYELRKEHEQISEYFIDNEEHYVIIEVNHVG